MTTGTLILLLFLLAALAGLILWLVGMSRRHRDLQRRFQELQTDFSARVLDGVAAWQARELDGARAAITTAVRQELALEFERWKEGHEAALRKDAVARSRAVTRGQVFEQLVPYLPHFRHHPKDARFVGAPIDFIVFDGLAEDRCDRVVFVEVKTGDAGLSTRERRVRDAVREGRVVWEELRVADEELEVGPEEIRPPAGPASAADASDDDDDRDEVIVRL